MENNNNTVYVVSAFYCDADLHGMKISGVFTELEKAEKLLSDIQIKLCLEFEKVYGTNFNYSVINKQFQKTYKFTSTMNNAKDETLLSITHVKANHVPVL